MESNNFQNLSRSVPNLKKDASALNSSKISSLFLWLLFLGNLGLLIYFFPIVPTWEFNDIFRINGFTLLIWTTVTFFSAIVSSYSSSYLKGFKFHSRFTLLCIGFTISVMFFISSNHIVPLITGWVAMGYFISRLIGVNTDWGEAIEAAKLSKKYFLASSVFLSIGVLLLSTQTNSYTITTIIKNLNILPNWVLIVSSLCIIISAIIQSAIYPFHKWLLSAMTAPTPASALMHAGFVNGSGILLTIFSSLLFASNTLSVLFIIGGITAIVAQFTKLIQVNVKQKLVCSTIAQMGFMIMQCGLGFFNAAVVHLILHGFYKAYLFLSAGENVTYSEPESRIINRVKPLQVFVVLLYAVMGGYLFNTFTGKGTTINSSIFLTVVVALTVGQLTYYIVKQKNVSILQRGILPPFLFLIGIGLYSIVYNAITLLMADMPFSQQPTPITELQIVFGVVFLICFFMMKLGLYRKSPSLYVMLMNNSQPQKNTILLYKSK